MTVVMKVSKPTYNALTTDNANLSFSSELATHSIYNIITVIKGAGSGSVTYTHNLGFVPKAWVFWSTSDGDGNFYQRIPSTPESVGEAFDYYITSTTLVITSDTAAPARTFRVILFTRSQNP